MRLSGPHSEADLDPRAAGGEKTWNAFVLRLTVLGCLSGAILALMTLTFGAPGASPSTRQWTVAILFNAIALSVLYLVCLFMIYEEWPRRTVRVASVILTTASISLLALVAYGIYREYFGLEAFYVLTRTLAALAIGVLLGWWWRRRHR